MTIQQAPSWRRWRGVLAGLALVAITVIAYVPALRAGFIWDDDNYVEQNVRLHTARGLGRIWFSNPGTVQYYPLTLTTFWTEYHLWGAAPFGYHLNNVLLHACSTVLLWRLLRRLQVPGAWMAAAVWAVHPVNVESVAWVTERKNVLSALFYLAAATVYVKDAALTEVKRRGYCLALGLFACAMLSKTTAATWPAAVLLVTWWKTGRLTGRDVLRMAPFFAIAIVGGVTTAWLEKHTIGASGADFDIPFLQRFVIAGRAIWFYAGKLLWPRPLMFIYPHWDIPMPSAMWACPAAVVAVLLTLFLLRQKIGRGPTVAALFFCGTLVPALGFVNVFPFRYSFVADHFQYLASAGLITGLVAALYRVPAGSTASWVRCVGGGLLVATFATLTSRYTRVYQNVVTLWADVVDKNPRSWMAQQSYAGALSRQAGAYATRGNAATASKRWAEALEHARTAADTPGSAWDARVQVGTIHEAMGDLAAAKSAYEQAAAQDPKQGAPHMMLGRLAERAGDLSTALREDRLAAEKSPGNEAAVRQLAKLLARQGQVDEAVAVLRQATEISPDIVLSHWDLADLLAHSGKTSEAIDEWRAGLANYPDDAAVWEKLGVALAATGRLDEAESALRRTLDLRPSATNARETLRAVRRLRGEPDDQPPPAGEGAAP